MRRFLQIALLTLLFVSFTYFILQAMPGDITQQLIFNPNVPPEAREVLKAQFGLDQPLHIQYFRFVTNFFQGDLGVSFSHYPRPVWDIIAERLPRTVMLFLSSTIISFYIGFLMGRHVAWKRGTALDYAATVVGVTFWTAFYPLLALILIWIFGFKLGWLPLNQFIEPMKWRHADFSANFIFARMIYSALAILISGALLAVATKRFASTPRRRKTVNVTGALAIIAATTLLWARTPYGYYAWDILLHMVLPVFTLALINFAGTMLLMRDSMLATIREDYVHSARARGLSDKVVRDRYAARTALLPVVTSFALSLGNVTSGGVVTESVFSWPGIGRTLLDASLAGDYPLAVGAFTFTGIFVLFAHMVADILYAVLDPRLRTEGGE